MSVNPAKISDLELIQSQWAQLGEILELVQASRSVKREDALRLLHIRGLDRVRPLVLYISDEPTELTTVEDKSHAQSCVKKALTPKQDWEPGDTDDPSTASLEFHIPALLAWLKTTNLDLDVSEWQKWKCDTLPELKRRKLLKTVPTRETPLDPAIYSAKVIRLADAPGYLGMNKNKFNKDVRPQLVELEYGDRSIGFNRRDLDQWVDQQTGTDDTTERITWEL